MMKSNTLPVIDLHCDLLTYLCQDSQRTPHDFASHCSLPQLHAGNIKLQTLAIFAETTKSSVEEGKKQVEKFSELITHLPEHFTRFKLPLEDTTPLIQIAPAFENASAFSSEEEPLNASIERLEEYI